MEGGFLVVMFVLGLATGLLVASQIDNLKGEGVPFVPFI